jgi:hypothetical protein
VTLFAWGFQIGKVGCWVVEKVLLARLGLGILPLFLLGMLWGAGLVRGFELGLIERV